jgi:hypothetical protein
MVGRWIGSEFEQGHFIARSRFGSEFEGLSHFIATIRHTISNTLGSGSKAKADFDLSTLSQTTGG